MRAPAEAPLTSGQMGTDPVIRRSLGDLRRAGLVQVRPGARASQRLSRPATGITLLDAVAALHHGVPDLKWLGPELLAVPKILV